MSTIPKEIQEKIEAEAKRRWALSDERFSEEDFKQGAEYGYQLATDGREELGKELQAHSEALLGCSKEINSLQNGLKEIMVIADDTTLHKGLIKIWNIAKQLLNKSLMEIPKEIISEDLQEQVRNHIKEDLFNWDEALTDEEMIFLEQLLLTFAPMFNKGSIGFAKTIQPHLTALQSQCTEKDQEIKKLLDEKVKDFIESTDEISTQSIALKVASRLINSEIEKNNQKSKQIEELKAENEALKKRIAEIVYLSEQPGGYHP